MVNTFLIDADFKKSAEMLDTKRLGKQRVEALQILHLIQYLRILSIYYASIENSPGPIPLNPYDQYLWIRKVAKLYNSSPTRLLKRNGLWYEVDKNIKMIRMATNEEIESDDGDTIVLKDVNTNRTRKVKSSLLIRRDEIYISLGFVYHPAVLMWLNFEDALKEYINIHIDEWISRGHKNTISKYHLEDHIDRPPWTYDDYFHMTHKCNLLRKELENDETPHYQQLFNLSQLQTDYPYFWPYTPKASSGICDSRKRYQVIVNIAKL